MMFTRLLRFRLRRDRWQLIVWAVAHFLVTALVVSAVQTTYGTAASRISTIKVLMVTPAILIFRGTPHGASEGDFVALLGLTFIALLVVFQSTFLVIRHTRAEEERGQAETIAATAAGRLAPTLAVVVLGVIANGIATVAIALACLVGGLPAAGSWVFAAACGTSGLAFVGIAFVFAQLFPTSRGANSWAATAAVVAYFVRGIGDAAGTPHAATLTLSPAWPRWVSPIGWAQATLPWAENRLWPLALGPLAVVVLTGVALVMQERRDVGAGVFAERKGRATASRRLGGAFGLAVRLERGVLAGWIAGVVAVGLLLGGLSGVVVNQLSSAGPGVTSAINAIGGANGTVLDAFANVGAIFSALLASAICVQGAMRLRQEESAGGAELVLSAATGRVRWMLAFLVVSGIGAIVSLLLGGLAAGAAAGAKGGGFGTWFWAIVWEIPAVLVFLGVVALVFALLPSATIVVGWAIFALGAVIGLFGPLFGLPDWARQLAPFAHTPQVALPDPSYTGGWVMAVIAVALVVASVLLFRLRDTRPGS
ncbi:ABC transporter permease [Gryllotalpicola reticulitermitis]|uniref:ABC transporter permease n=1 Tax=Gryllotalpicola reticulitermitis TaxID=1184153 RepID=A0ABV8Q9R9_9MICO